MKAFIVFLVLLMLAAITCDCIGVFYDIAWLYAGQFTLLAVIFLASATLILRAKQ